jgi:hypothetical protein
MLESARGEGHTNSRKNIATRVGAGPDGLYFEPNNSSVMNMS